VTGVQTCALPIFWVVFHIHSIPPPAALRIRPMKRDALPLVGIFATRSPQRPNPIGVTAVQLLEVRGNMLRVRGLDAIDGTPVLDVKPYLALGDAISDTRVPDWVKQYWRSRNLQDPKGF
jgi:tRNA-Thr(GGU) m(6)t(6)A37 methyltransferase TsaA